MRAFVASDAKPLHELIDRNLDHLRRWLAWVDLDHSVAGKLAFIESCRLQYAEGSGLQLAYVEDGEIIGVLGFNTIERMHHQAEIGYWLAADREGAGLMTRGAVALVRHGFEELALHRQFLRAATENVRSRAVAERLGFALEGIEREAELVNGRYLDLARYAALADEWRPPGA